MKGRAVPDPREHDRHRVPVPDGRGADTYHRTTR